MDQTALNMEFLGIPVARIRLPLVRMPSLCPTNDLLADELPDMGGANGYFFPSAIRTGDPLPKSPEGFFWLERTRFPRYFLDLEQNMDEFLTSKSPKTRSTLRRKMRKFEKASGGSTDWQVFQTAQEMEEFHRRASPLAERTYQAKLYDAAMPTSSAFRDEMVRRAEQGAAVGFLLLLEGEVAAYLYAPIKQGRVVYGFLGFDSKYRSLSPGTVLQMLIMEWCFAQSSLKTFDFTEGEGAHKTLFSSFKEDCTDILLLRKTFKIIAISRLYRAMKWLSEKSTGLLDTIGVKSPIKKWLRRTRG